MDIEDIKKQEELWKDVILKGEMLTIKLITEEAKKELEERIASFLITRKEAIASNKISFLFRDREYTMDTDNVDIAIKTWANTKNIGLHRALLAYRKAETNAWIYKTLLDKKKTGMFKVCNKLILIGSGIYPYSMFDIHKKYKHIQQIGIEINNNRAAIGRDLVNKSPARDHIKIITCDGCNYNYEDLDEDDLVFVSCDVDNKKIMNRVIETSKAHIFICAPYEKTWLRALVQNVKVSKSSSGITSYTD
tara:strand:- start:71 stop:817 length:747 start_codon:yes stop_codon:yes gene_type:complete